MPIYTFEKHQASRSLAGKLAIVDTSYMIALSDEDDERNKIVAPFHINASETGATFAINSVVRQEFIKDVRKKVLIDAILSLAASDPLLEARYKSVLGQSKPLSVGNLKHGYEKIYKDHIKQGDDFVILTHIAESNSSIWETVSRFETETNLVYTRPKPGTNGDDLWQSLGDLISLVGMDATDAMIANLGFNIGADAIITTDCDFVCLASVLDIYVPESVATHCVNYSESADIAAAL